MLKRAICIFPCALCEMDPPRLHLVTSSMNPLTGQLEAALASAHQRIAELEAQVESLEATVQSLKEALTAAIGHAGHLQVTHSLPTQRIAWLGGLQYARSHQGNQLKALSSFEGADKNCDRLEDKPCLGSHQWLCKREWRRVCTGLPVLLFSIL